MSREEDEKIVAEVLEVCIHGKTSPMGPINLRKEYCGDCVYAAWKEAYGGLDAGLRTMERK